NENEVHISLRNSDKPKKHYDKAKREAKGKSPVDLSTRVRDLIEELKNFLLTALTGPSDNVVSLTFETGGKSLFVDPSQYPDDPDMYALEDIVYSDDKKIPSDKEYGKDEPKRVHQALKDPSWIGAMQEELLQFKMQKFWVLVDLPKGKRVIGSKWVFRNKKDKRGIVIGNKA
nr:putative ribonuclease H-like domain-containing protein [Tanacetum cinerariifolium]